MCVRVAPLLFQLRGKGPATTLLTEPPPELDEAAREAETLCPAGAVIVDD